MKRRMYCCDASRGLYEEYYSRQNGGEIPVFAGSRVQRGHGLGSILGGFFSSAGVAVSQDKQQDHAGECDADGYECCE